MQPTLDVPTVRNSEQSEPDAQIAATTLSGHSTEPRLIPCVKVSLQFTFVQQTQFFFRRKSVYDVIKLLNHTDIDEEE